MIRTYSISTFLGTSTDDDFLGPKQSITEKINNFFNDNQDEDDNIDDGGDDTGE